MGRVFEAVYKKKKKRMGRKSDRSNKHRVRMKGRVYIYIYIYSTGAVSSEGGFNAGFVFKANSTKPNQSMW